MIIISWYLHAWRHYADFTSRVNRAELWLFSLVNNVGTWLLSALLTAAHSPHFGSILGLIVILVLIVPTVAVQVRRLHDLNRSGWWTLWILLPLLGAIILFFFDVWPGSAEANVYGPPAFLDD